MISAELGAKWQKAKKAEDKAKEKRLEIEAEIIEGEELPLEGTVTKDGVKVTTKITRTVDYDKVLETGRDDLIKKLFRHKLEINKPVWDAEDPEIIKIFSGAVTSKSAKPSISIKE